MKLLTTIYNLEHLHDLSQAADGFILGNEQFAVRLTKSFSIHEIHDAANIIHSLGKELFIVMNQMMTDEQLIEAKSIIESLPNDLIKGYIIADLGLIDVFKSLNLNHKVVYNPETLLTNYIDFNYLQDDHILGAFVSKEITLEDIKIIGSKKAYNLFMFGHGHQSMFYSKRPILDAYTDYLGKDRVYYKEQGLALEEEKRKSESFPILEDKGGTHVFRGVVFNSLNDIKALSSVVDYLIIDTLFKDDQYAKEVLPLYKHEQTDVASIQKIQEVYRETWNDGFLHKKTIYKGKTND
jgi:putative protease